MSIFNTNKNCLLHSLLFYYGIFFYCGIFLENLLTKPFVLVFLIQNWRHNCAYQSHMKNCRHLAKLHQLFELQHYQVIGYELIYPAFLLKPTKKSFIVTVSLSLNIQYKNMIIY